MAVHLTAADLASVMLLLDASTIAKNVGRRLLLERESVVYWYSI